ncbi:hypothetical protein J6590_088803 [Homalodisca vitripennis]|nr:hypothetical protein J6590_088803 [Homalodisca vitripennis]
MSRRTCVEIQGVRLQDNSPMVTVQKAQFQRPTFFRRTDAEEMLAKRREKIRVVILSSANRKLLAQARRVGPERRARDTEILSAVAECATAKVTVSTVIDCDVTDNYMAGVKVQRHYQLLRTVPRLRSLTQPLVGPERRSERDRDTISCCLLATAKVTEVTVIDSDVTDNNMASVSERDRDTISCCLLATAKVTDVTVIDSDVTDNNMAGVWVLSGGAEERERQRYYQLLPTNCATAKVTDATVIDCDVTENNMAGVWVRSGGARETEILSAVAYCATAKVTETVSHSSQRTDYGRHGKLLDNVN